MGEVVQFNRKRIERASSDEVRALTKWKPSRCSRARVRRFTRGALAVGSAARAERLIGYATMRRERAGSSKCAANCG